MNNPKPSKRSVTWLMLRFRLHPPPQRVVPQMEQFVYFASEAGTIMVIGQTSRAQSHTRSISLLRTLQHARRNLTPRSHSLLDFPQRWRTKAGGKQGKPAAARDGTGETKWQYDARSAGHSRDEQSVFRAWQGRKVWFKCCQDEGQATDSGKQKNGNYIERYWCSR